MPELPEVEITRQKLLPLICGRRIFGFWTDWPRGLRAYSGQRIAGRVRWVAGDMRGRKILEVTRRGKVLFFTLSGELERVMAIHLRMSGRLEVANVAKTANTAKEMRWTHFRWQLSGGKILRFVDLRKFGRVWYGAPVALAADPYLGSLGQDAKTLSRPAFVAALENRRGMIKPLLLRQDIVAGIGNIIADESLWRARIHPAVRAQDLARDKLTALHTAIRSTIRLVLAAGGNTVRSWTSPDGQRGRYPEQWRAYGRTGKPCPRCRTTLKRIIVGSRGTTFCPMCQRLEA